MSFLNLIADTWIGPHVQSSNTVDFLPSLLILLGFTILFGVAVLIAVLIDRKKSSSRVQSADEKIEPDQNSTPSETTENTLDATTEDSINNTEEK